MAFNLNKLNAFKRLMSVNVNSNLVSSVNTHKLKKANFIKQ